jgi:hypothetical protein
MISFIIGTVFAIGAVEFAAGMWIGRWLLARETQAEVPRIASRRKGRLSSR